MRAAFTPDLMLVACIIRALRQPDQQPPTAESDFYVAEVPLVLDGTHADLSSVPSIPIPTSAHHQLYVGAAEWHIDFGNRHDCLGPQDWRAIALTRPLSIGASNYKNKTSHTLDISVA